MFVTNSAHSPEILIYLQVGEKRVSLADVLCDTALLDEAAEFAPGTLASLVFSIDGVEEGEEVVLVDGLAAGSSIVTFSCASQPARHFS